MAYRRKTRVARRRPTRKSSRRSYAKKRTYRKPMSKKRILNITSTKKRDTMLSVSNTAANGASRAVAIGAAVINGNDAGRFLWSPTMRDLTNSSGGFGAPGQQAVRTATTCYMRGLSEHIRIQTSSGIPWFHRRICFTSKGVSPFIVKATADTTTPNPTTPYFDTTSNGITRLFLNATINNQQNTTNEREAIIFKGANGLDWNDILIAPTDSTRITVKFDKTWTIKSGNERGTVIERKLWHPMNKNLVYDDDESGDNETTNYYSTDSRAGMGDYYVYDIITPGAGGTSTDQILLTSNASLYWHEK